MNKQTKTSKFVTVRVDAELAKALVRDDEDIETALDALIRSHANMTHAKPGKVISKRIADSHSAFLEKYGSLSDEFGTL